MAVQLNNNSPLLELNNKPEYQQTEEELYQEAATMRQAVASNFIDADDYTVEALKDKHMLYKEAWINFYVYAQVNEAQVPNLTLVSNTGEHIVLEDITLIRRNISYDKTRFLGNIKSCVMECEVIGHDTIKGLVINHNMKKGTYTCTLDGIIYDIDGSYYEN